MKSIAKVGVVASTALIALAVIGANPANAAHNPRPGGQGAGPGANQQGAPTAQSDPSTAIAPTAGRQAGNGAATTSTNGVATTSATSATAQTATGTTAPATPGAQPQRGPRPGGAPLGSLIGAGTITADQARAVRDQLRTDAQAARAQARTTALDTLVGEGELTQAQADAIAAAGRGGLRTLVSNGTLTAEQARTVQAEFAEYGTVDTSAASLAALVAAGVLTQDQADAIAALIPAPGSRS